MPQNAETSKDAGLEPSYMRSGGLINDMSALSAGSEREPVPFATGRQRKSSYVRSALHQRSQRSPLIRRNETKGQLQAQGPMPRACVHARVHAFSQSQLPTLRFNEQ
jgi:hypothetical protein